MPPVAHYSLVMDPADWKQFHRRQGTDRYFEAVLEMDGRRWPVWIGYRGRYSLGFRKPSYEIWFHEDTPLKGHARLHLNAAYRDPSMLRSRLTLGLFSQIGVPAPIAWPVWLTINQEPAGLYTAVESVDAAWLKRRGLPDGPIYYGVGSQGNFGLTDSDTGQRKKFLASGYEKCWPADDDFSDLSQLVLQVTLPDPDRFASQIQQVLDVEEFLRWLIGVEFMSHTDGLVQNYALFQNEAGLWQISPWDCDGTWGRVPNGGRYSPWEMTIGHGDGNYLIARLLTTSTFWSRYLDLWEELLTLHFTPDQVSQRVKVLWRQIRPYGLQDTTKRYANSTLRREPARIRNWAAQRFEYVQRRLASWRSAGSMPPLSERVFDDGAGDWD